MKLTAQNVEKLQPQSRRQEVPDDLCPGSYLVIQPQPSGAKSWTVRYRHGGVQRRMTLGPYPVLSLAAARVRARSVLAAVAEGRDPAQEVKEARAPKETEARNRVSALVAVYTKRHLSGLRTGASVARELDRHVVSKWGDNDIRSIARRDVIDLIDGIADTGRPISANRVRAYLSGFFGWCMSRDIIDRNPVLGTKPAVKERSRDRVLSDTEIRWLWAAADRVEYPFGPLAKVLLLTGQRRGEVAGMNAAEVDGDRWLLRASRTKNGRPYEVHLSEPVRAILAELEVPSGPAGYYLTTNGQTAASGFTKARQRLH